MLFIHFFLPSLYILFSKIGIYDCFKYFFACYFPVFHIVGLGYNNRAHILICDCDNTQEKFSFYSPPSHPIFPVLFPQPFNIFSHYIPNPILSLQLTVAHPTEILKKPQAINLMLYHLSMPLKNKSSFQFLLSPLNPKLS